MADDSVTRDFAATTFVVWRSALLLHRHAKLGIWLPPGGHIEPNELPDEAAVREVKEETGVDIELVGERVLPLANPRQLVRPRAVQLEAIAPGHEHIDLIYYGRPVPGYRGELLPGDDTLGWYGLEQLACLDLTQEMRHWVRLVMSELG